MSATGRSDPTGHLLAGVLVLGCFAGCAAQRHDNEAAVLRARVRASDDGVFVAGFKAGVLVPARDILTLDPLWRALFGSPARNTASAAVPDGSFVTDRRLGELSPVDCARGPCTMPAPQPPFSISKVKTSGATDGFIGTDATGRTFLFKLDDPAFPELGSSAAIIGSRILWCLGYHVPPVYLVEVTGTGDGRFDGRRGTAALFLDNVRGHFHFDWFRYRRELRALRLASAWINDVDRVGTNTLVVTDGATATGYLIDFNSCLGAWQGTPKEPWRGWRHNPDLAWALLNLLSFGRLPQAPATSVVAPAVGRFCADSFDPARWRSQWPNNAFAHLTAGDARWIAGRIRQLDTPRLRAIVAAAQLSDPEDANYLLEVLLARRERLLTAIGALRDRPDHRVVWP